MLDIFKTVLLTLWFKK